MQPGLRSGKLTKWKDERGFGFIQPVDGSQEVFYIFLKLKMQPVVHKKTTRFITTA
jgi:cold shock CspA family protein